MSRDNGGYGALTDLHKNNIKADSYNEETTRVAFNNTFWKDNVMQLITIRDNADESKYIQFIYRIINNKYYIKVLNNNGLSLYTQNGYGTIIISGASDLCTASVLYL